MLEKTAIAWHLSGKGHQKFEKIELGLNNRNQSAVNKDLVSYAPPRIAKEDKAFRSSMLFSFLKAGVPIKKIIDMKSDLEHVAKRSLERVSDLKANYLTAILNARWSYI